MHKLCVLLQSMYPPWANAHWFGATQSSVLLVPMHRDLTWCSSAQTLINQLSAVRQTARSTLLLLTMHFVPTYQKHVLEINVKLYRQSKLGMCFSVAYPKHSVQHIV